MPTLRLDAHNPPARYSPCLKALFPERCVRPPAPFPPSLGHSALAHIRLRTVLPQFCSSFEGHQPLCELARVRLRRSAGHVARLRRVWPAIHHREGPGGEDAAQRYAERRWLFAGWSVVFHGTAPCPPGSDRVTGALPRPIDALPRPIDALPRPILRSLDRSPGCALTAPAAARS